MHSDVTLKSKRYVGDEDDINFFIFRRATQEHIICLVILELIKSL